MKSIKVSLTLSEARLLENVLERQAKGLLQEIDHAEYSREFRESLQSDYDHLVVLQDKVSEACRKRESGRPVNIVIVDGVDHQAM